MVMTLGVLAACYDFSLPEGGAGGAASGGSDPSSGGAGGGEAGGGAGGAPSYPPPCDQWSCDQCATCTVDFFAGNVASCQAYDACIASCMGAATCEAGCQGDHPAGLFLRESLDNQCTDVCSGVPPCGG